MKRRRTVAAWPTPENRRPLAGGNEEMRARDAKATIQNFINMNVHYDKPVPP